MPEPGGVLLTSGLTALLTPIFCAAAGQGSSAASSAPATPGRRKAAGFIRLLESELRSDDDRVAGVAVERQIGGDDVALRLHDEADPRRHLEDLGQPETPAVVVAAAEAGGEGGAAGDAARVGRFVIVPGAGHIRRRLPGEARPADR